MVCVHFMEGRLPFQDFEFYTEKDGMPLEGVCRGVIVLISIFKGLDYCMSMQLYYIFLPF